MIDRQSVEPGCERRITTKTAELAEEVDEDFLRQVLSLSRVRHHPQAEAVDAPVVPLVERLERVHITTRGRLRQFKV